jgi:hypothetical protein
MQGLTATETRYASCNPSATLAQPSPPETTNMRHQAKRNERVDL